MDDIGTERRLLSLREQPISGSRMSSGVRPAAGGRPLGYFDDLALYELVVLTTIDIAPDLMHLRWKDEIYPLPYSRNFRWMSQYKNANLLLIAH